MYLYRLAHTLGDLGHNVDVIHCIDSYQLLHPKDPEIEFADHPKVKTHGLQLGRGWLSPLMTHQTGRLNLKRGPIREVLDRKQYDVLHYHNISLLGPEILTLQPTRGHAVKIYTAHEHWLVCPTHVLWKFNSRLCEKPQCLQCTIRAKRPPQIWRYTGLLAKTSRHVDQFVSPSRFTAKMHAKRGFPRPLTRLPLFIAPVDRDWKDPDPRPQEKPYFLFVGRLERIKGLQTLIEVWKWVAHVDLLVAGEGTYEPQLKALAASNSRIKFVGALPQDKLGALYFHALACIVPSITYETFGIIIIEAFARKTPVIVRDLGALPEVVHDSGGGFVYRTQEELLEAIKRIASSSALRCELGEKGYDGFVRWWSKEAHLKRYFDLLRQIAVKRFGIVPWEKRDGNPYLGDQLWRSVP